MQILNMLDIMLLFTRGVMSVVWNERKVLYVKYDETKLEDMVVVSFETGMIIKGDKKTPSDTPTHLEWYRYFY